MSRKLYEIAVAKLRLGKVNCKYYHSNKLSDSILKCHCYKLLVNNFVLGLLSFVVAAFFCFQQGKEGSVRFSMSLSYTYIHTFMHPHTHAHAVLGTEPRTFTILRNHFAELA